MARGRLILIAVLVLIIGGAILLSSLDTEVPPAPVEKAVANGALAQ